MSLPSIRLWPGKPHSHGMAGSRIDFSCLRWAHPSNRTNLDDSLMTMAIEIDIQRQVGNWGTISHAHRPDGTRA